MTQSYYIRESETLPNGKDIFFEGALVGQIYYSTLDKGYIVRPTWAEYKGFFHTFEKACIELIFHYWTNYHTTSVYC